MMRYSRNGEVVGSRNDFRMNTANIHTPTGCVLLDLTFASFIGLMTPIPPVLKVADGNHRLVILNLYLLIVMIISFVARKHTFSCRFIKFLYVLWRSTNKCQISLN